MQNCSCIVRIGGNVHHEVFKADVSVPEIALLRAIHGNDGVVQVKPTRMTKTPHATELLRLRGIYGTDKAGDELITKLWPGLSPRLPVSLKDIAVEEAEPPDMGEDDDTGVPGADYGPKEPAQVTA